MEQCKHEGKIAALESNINTVFKRMDEQLTVTKAVYELAAEIKVMNQRLEAIEAEQKRSRKNFEELSAKPAKRWETLITAIITAVVGIVVGAVLRGVTL